MQRPVLVLVTGPSGSGKSTLARRLSRAVGCPAVLRDKIKEGLVHADPSFTSDRHHEFNLRANDAFFAVLSVLVSAGSGVVAEAAFQHRLWAPGLAPLVDVADLRIVRCSATPQVARERVQRRLCEDPRLRSEHQDASWLAAQSGEDGAGAVRAGPGLAPEFTPLALRVPTLEVDTTDGYAPGLDEVVAFASGR